MKMAKEPIKAVEQPPTKPPTFSASEKLTPSEIAQLRQKDKEASDYAQKTFRRLTPSEIESLRQDAKRSSAMEKELIAADKAKAGK